MSVPHVTIFVCHNFHKVYFGLFKKLVVVGMTKPDPYDYGWFYLLDSDIYGAWTTCGYHVRNINPHVLPKVPHISFAYHRVIHIVGSVQ